MNLLRIAIFALASAGLVCVSRTSLRRPRAHGFWRFWAWEAIAALVVLAEGARRPGFAGRWPGISSSRGRS